MTDLTTAQRAALAGLAGTVCFPGDPGYAELCAPWNVAVVTTPLAAVGVTSAEEVARVVAFASAERIPVAVQATGHGAWESLDAAILIVTRGLDEVTIHADERWARVGAGVAWQAVLDAAGEHGLGAMAGSSPTVGVVGYTTGGGHGPIARSHGLAIDRVRAFDVVTGDGVLRRATATEEPDLFWALRGGKGAVGIVTAIEFDLLALPVLYAGALFFDGEHAATVLRAWADWCPSLPPEATTSVGILQLPAMPGVPPMLAGRTTLTVRFAWTGEAAAGEAALAPIRAAAPMLMDAVGMLPFQQLARIHNDPVDPLPSHEGHAILDTFDAAAADALLAAAGPGAGSPQVLVEVRQLGGAIAQEPAVPAAFARRDAAYSLFCVGIAAPPLGEAVAAHEVALRRAMEPWTAKGGLPNFCLGADQVRFMRAFPADVHVRLASVARTYDPNGILVAGRGLR
jgi:FAD/FMN-containing dehydrogenase